MTPTPEQISAALALLQNELGGEELASTMGTTVFDAVTVLLSAIPALAAELDADRKAHAEMRARLQMMTDERHRITDGYHSLKASHEDMCQQWRYATGHASPEAYRASMVEPSRWCNECEAPAVVSGSLGSFCVDCAPAGAEERNTLPRTNVSKVEPGADVIERLRQIYNDAYEDVRDVAGSKPAGQANGIRAVIAALAEMGAEAPWPSLDEIASAWHGAPVGGADCSRRVLASFKVRLATVLGARRALDIAPVLTPEEGQRAWNAVYGPGAPFEHKTPAPPTDEQLAEDLLSSMTTKEKR